MQSGKDTAANTLIKLGWKRLAFADMLKKEIAQALSIAVKDINSDKESFRELLQWWGMWRRKSDPLYWVNGLTPSLEYYAAKEKPVVVTDARFINELTVLQDRQFLTVQIVPKEFPTKYSASWLHVSEQEWRLWKPNFVIQNVWNGLDGLASDVLSVVHS